MVKSAPGPHNTFMPNEEATNNMLVDFSRNPKDFALPRYAQYVPVEKTVGAYTEMNVEMAGRVLGDDGEDALWRDGHDAPENEGNLEEFEKKLYQTQRFNRGFRAGSLTVEQAPWDVVAQASRHAYQRTMTARTMKATKIVTTAANMISGHAVDLASPPAGSGITGRLDVATTSNMNIKRTLDWCADLIQLATLGAVKPSEIMFLLSATVARRLSVTQEFRDHVKQSNVAMQTIKGEIGPKDNFGFPETLYDYDMIVENTVRVSTNKRVATQGKNYVMPDKLVALSRVGGLEGIEGSPSFSSLQIFFKEEGTVEDKLDTDNRVHKGRVVDDYAVNFTSPLSTVLVENVLT